MIPLPRLFIDKKFSRTIHPETVAITENIIPLSTATMTLQEGDEMPTGSWAELFTPYGSAGMYRMRSPRSGYGSDDTTIQLEHMIAEVGDYLARTEIDQMMDAQNAVRTIFSHYRGGLWKLGKISDLTGTVAVEFSYESILTVLLAILQQRPALMLTYDFKTTPWTVNIVKRGTTVVSQGRLSRNVEGATVSADESTLITRVYYQTWSQDNDGNVVGKWTSKDGPTFKTYGTKERRLDTNYEMTAAEISSMVNTFLEAHKHPRTSVSIRASELFRITGEKVDKFILGDLFRLAIPKYKRTVELNITSIVWQDVYERPESVMVHLGEEEETVVTFLHNLDSTGEGSPGGGGGGGGRKKQEEEWKEYISWWHVTDEKIDGGVKRIDKAEKILEQAGLQINSKGVLIYADNGTKNTLYSKFKVTNDAISSEVKDRKKVEDQLSSKIKQQANKISLVVEEKNGVNVINAAKIVLGINAQTGSYAKIDADTIDLNGSVLADEIATERGRITNLMAGNSLVSKLWATTVSTSVLQVGGTTASWQLKNIPGVGYINYLGA